ncbi:MAG: TAXI family TRAP transporter solute-binding subunit [Oscillospiraceae bacterium]|jgi:TRAP transporter TAXI family solute receptor
MKKTCIVVVSVLLICALLFCACETPTPNSNGNFETAPLNFATGGTSGTYYTYGGAIAQTLNDNFDNLDITIQSSGAFKANIFLIDDDKANLAIVGNDIAYYAYNGTGLFQEDGAITSFSAIAALYPEICQIVSTEKITSVGDLKGKRVSVGDSLSSVESNARQILETYGITFDDIAVLNLSFSDSIDALKSGKIDAFFCITDAPATAISQLIATNEMHILAIDNEHAKKLIEAYPFYTQHTILADTYQGIDEDIATVAIQATLIASNDLSDEVVNSIVRGLFECQEELSTSHEKGAELDPSYAVSGVSIPFHSGAKAYFTEVGILS